MENREMIKEELTELLENYYNGSFSELVGDYIRRTEMTQQEVERVLEEMRKAKGAWSPFCVIDYSFNDSSMTAIFWVIKSKSAFSFSTFRFISLTKLLPFLDELVKKPMLFS